MTGRKVLRHRPSDGRRNLRPFQAKSPHNWTKDWLDYGHPAPLAREHIPHFRSDHNILSIAAERLSKDLLALALRVHVGSVKEIDAVVSCRVKQFNHLVTVRTTEDTTESRATETES
jgi:hypothetical protein